MSKSGAWGSELVGAGLDIPIDFDLSGGTNGVYAGPPPWIFFANAAQAANTLYFSPILLPVERTITELLVTVIAAVVGNGRVGIYAPRPNSSLPGKLLVDAGTFSTNVTNTDQRKTGLNVKLSPGFYLGATVFDAAANVRRSAGTAQFGHWYPAGASLGQWTGFYRAFTYGALPADETAQAAAAYGAGPPTIVFMK